MVDFAKYLQMAARQVRQAGRGGDTELLHVRPDEIPAIQRALHTKGTINPFTRVREFGGGGGAINGAGGSGNVSGGGRGNAAGGGRGNNAGKSVDRVNDRAGMQQRSWQGDGAASSGGNGPSDGGTWSTGPEAPPGGGTYTSNTYSPGAVGNYPDANAAAVADMLSSAIPGMGLANSGYKAAKVATGDGDLSANNFGPLGDALGADAGPQKGWAPDRNHGAVNPFGGQGSAQGSVLRRLRVVPTQTVNPLVDALQPSKTYSSATTTVV